MLPRVVSSLAVGLLSSRTAPREGAFACALLGMALAVSTSPGCEFACGLDGRRHWRPRRDDPIRQIATSATTTATSAGAWEGASQQPVACSTRHRMACCCLVSR
jgi:hypothetical protein